MFCTHLSAVFDDIPFPDEGSWEAEQAAQIDALLSFIDDKAGAEGQVMVLGDFNNGPVVGDIPAEIPDNYAALTSAGLTNPYAGQEGAACTYCPENLLTDTDSPAIIDHVLVRGLDGSLSAERFLTGEIDIDVADIGTVTTSYSDHYGVALTAER